MKKQSQAKKTGGASAKAKPAASKTSVQGKIKLKKILLPVDFSDRSRYAMRYALRLAEQFQAKVFLLHVVEVTYVGAEPGFVNLVELELELAETRSAQLDEVVKKDIRGKVPAEALVKMGRAFHVINETADEIKADLIVISTHGYTGLKHVLMGSTAERVVRHANCPVLTVRPEERGFV